MRRIIVCIFMLAFGFSGYAMPQSSIEGYVYSGNQPMAGVNVMVKGTSKGTETDNNGFFKFADLPQTGFVIRASYIGFETREIKVKKGENISLPLKIEMREDLIKTESVVVTATRGEVNRKEAPVIVNAISAKALESTNSVNLAEGMRFLPGLRLETNCQNCGAQQVRINGLEGSYSQVLIDSRPVFSALSSVYGIQQIPAGMIERVEVIKGGGSALFGSNAVAGVINIITKEPAENSFQISGDVYSYAGKSPERNVTINGFISNEEKNAGAAIFASMKDRKYYDADGDGYSELGKLENHTFGFKTYIKPWNQGKFTLEYHNLHEFLRGGNNFDLQPYECDICEQTEHNINTGSISYSYITGNSDYEAYSALQHTARKSYYGAGKDPNAYGDTKDLTYVGGLQYARCFDNVLSMQMRLLSGAEYQYSNLRDKTPGYGRDVEQKAEIAGVFAQSEWALENAKVLIGARLDKHSLMDDPVLSPRVTFLYTFCPEIQSRLAYSTGYRAPQTFDEDLHISAVNGEALLIRLADGLKPEKSRSFSASVDFYPDFNNVRMNLLLESFYTKLKDVFVLNEIGDDAAGNKISERANGSGAEVYGITLESNIAPSRDFTAQIGFTYQRSLYKNARSCFDDSSLAPSRQMPRTPDIYGYFNLSACITDELDLSLSGIYTGPMDVPHYAGYIAKDEVHKSESFFELNTKIDYTFRFNNRIDIELNAGVQNIFNSYQNDFDRGADRDAGYIYGPSKPRTVSAGVKLSIN